MVGGMNGWLGGRQLIDGRHLDVWMGGWSARQLVCRALGLMAGWAADQILHLTKLHITECLKYLLILYSPYNITLITKN